LIQGQGSVQGPLEPQPSVLMQGQGNFYTQGSLPVPNALMQGQGSVYGSPPMSDLQPSFYPMQGLPPMPEPLQPGQFPAAVPVAEPAPLSGPQAVAVPAVTASKPSALVQTKAPETTAAPASTTSVPTALVQTRDVEEPTRGRHWTTTEPPTEEEAALQALDGGLDHLDEMLQGSGATSDDLDRFAQGGSFLQLGSGSPSGTDGVSEEEDSSGEEDSLGIARLFSEAEEPSDVVQQTSPGGTTTSKDTVDADRLKDFYGKPWKKGGEVPAHDSLLKAVVPIEEPLRYTRRKVLDAYKKEYDTHHDLLKLTKQLRNIKDHMQDKLEKLENEVEESEPRRVQEILNSGFKPWAKNFKSERKQYDEENQPKPWPKRAMQFRTIKLGQDGDMLLQKHMASKKQESRASS